MRKPMHFAFMILVAIVVLGLILSGIWFFVIREPVVKKGGAYSPYPYTWQRLEDGNLLLTITKDENLDYTWTAKNVPDNMITVSDGVPSETNENEINFTITPLEFGMENFFLVYDREGEIPDQLYAFQISVSVDENRKASIPEITGIPLNGIQVTEHEASGTYSQCIDYTGSLWISHTNKKSSYFWEVQEMNPEIVLMRQLEPEIDVLMRFVGVGKGDTTIKILGKPQSGGSSILLSIPLTVGDGFRFSTKPIEVTEQPVPVLATEAETENKKEVEKFLGRKISLPKEAVQQEYSIYKATLEDATEYEFGKVAFYYEGANWSYLITKELKGQPISQIMQIAIEEETAFTAGKITGKHYQVLDERIAFWESADGFSYGIGGPDISEEELIKLVEAVSAADFS